MVAKRITPPFDLRMYGGKYASVPEQRYIDGRIFATQNLQNVEWRLHEASTPVPI
jgi:hypothetical protein